MPHQLAKMSDMLKEMSERLFRQPDVAHSSEAVHVALFFANVAWNECVGLDYAREAYRNIWETIEADKPDLWNEFKSNDIDGMIAYVNIHDAGRLLRIEDKVQGVRLRFHDLFDAPDISSRLAARHPDLFYATNWTLTHGNLFSAIQMEKAMMALLLGFIVMVSAFNILSSLVMVVTDKKADIAILRTMGASPELIRRIFIVQGATIGIVGTAAGVALGVLLSLTIGDIATGIEHLFNVRLFDAYFVNYLPSELDWGDVFKVSVAALLLSLGATRYPANRAAAVQPAEALRYE